MGRDSVVIGYAHNGMVHQPWMECVLATQTAHPDLIEGTISAAGAYIAQNRNQVVRKFLDNATSDWLWFLDYDIIFSPETLPWLLKAGAEKGPGVYAALYFVRLKEGIRSTWLADRGGNPWTPVEFFGDRLEELTFCSMGATLIHRRVLLDTINEDDPWPWFGHDIMETPTGWERMSEDYVFCHRARAAGHNIWGVPVGCGHIKTQILDFDAYLEERRTHALGEAGS
jgi:Glycosyl transferase family 2